MFIIDYLIIKHYYGVPEGVGLKSLTFFWMLSTFQDIVDVIVVVSVVVSVSVNAPPAPYE